MEQLLNQLRTALEEKSLEGLEAFSDPKLHELLSDEEREELAELFFRRCEKALATEGLEACYDWFEQARYLSDAPYLFLSRQAGLLFQKAVALQDFDLIPLAIDRLDEAFHLAPEFFDDEPRLYMMWGNLLVVLGRTMHRERAFEEALEKYASAEKCFEKPDQQLLWDQGEAWTFLAEYSGELSDADRAIGALTRAEEMGNLLPHFQLSFAKALVLKGRLRGQSAPLEEAIERYQKVIRLCESAGERTLLSAHHNAWISLAMTYKQRWYLTGEEEHYTKADQVFQEAILAVPDAAVLWKEWGELLMRVGALTRNLYPMEVALEKLTASKIEECDPIEVSALIIEALAYMGLFLQDIELLKDAKNRLAQFGEVEEDSSPALFYVSGVLLYTSGHYFQDESLFEEAISWFEKAVEKDGRNPFYWWSLSLAYQALGESRKDVVVLRKALRPATRSLELAPQNPFFWSEVGAARLTLARFETSHELAINLLEEALVHLNRAIEMSHHHAFAEWVYNAGICLDLLGDLTEKSEFSVKAVEVLATLYQKDPDYFQVRFHYGLALSHLGAIHADPESLYQAIEIFQECLAIDAEDGEVHNELGLVFLLLSNLIDSPHAPDESFERIVEADKHFRRAVESGFSPALFQLACIHSMGGSFAASVDFLMRAEEAGVLPPMEEVMESSWLEGVRNSPEFSEFLEMRERRNL